MIIGVILFTLASTTVLECTVLDLVKTSFKNKENRIVVDKILLK